jgi:hypothetical protein
MTEQELEELFGKVDFEKLIRDEILTSLKEVPNPEANRTAINRIMSI